jgi:hypothetical protein
MRKNSLQKIQRVVLAWGLSTLGIFLLFFVWISATSSNGLQNTLTNDPAKQKGVFYDVIGESPKTEVVAADTQRRLHAADEKSSEPAYTIEIARVASKVDAQILAGRPELSQKNCFYVPSKAASGSEYIVRCGIFTSEKMATKNMRRLARTVKNKSKIARF